MADLAHASENDNDLHGDTDAMHWAKRFASKFKVLHKDGVDLNVADLMLAWFASAIETGRMAGESGHVDKPPDQVQQ